MKKNCYTVAQGWPGMKALFTARCRES